MAWKAIRNQLVVTVASVTAGTPRVAPPTDPLAQMRSPVVIGGTVLVVGPQVTSGILVGDTVFFTPQIATVLDDVTVLVTDNLVEAASR